MHTSPCLMWFTIQSLQRDLGERIDKLDSSSWGIRVECLSRCRWKLGKHLIEKNINIALRVVRHARSQHNCHMISSSKSYLFSSYLFYYSCLFKFYFFSSLYFYSTPLLLLTNWVFTNASTNKVPVDSTLGLPF